MGFKRRDSKSGEKLSDNGHQLKGSRDYDVKRSARPMVLRYLRVCKRVRSVEGTGSTLFYVVAVCLLIRPWMVIMYFFSTEGVFVGRWVFICKIVE